MSGRARGFTLVELLVAMVLLSLVMLGMVSAMRTLGDTQSRVDERLERNDQVRNISGFLTQILARMSPQTASSLNAPSPPGRAGGTTRADQVLRFQLTGDSLNWVGIMPARPGMGGRYFFRLGLEANAEGGQDLLLRHVPWTASVADLFPDWASAPAEVLVRNVSTFAVEAQSERAPRGVQQAAWSADWRADWPVAQQLPERLRVQIADAHSAWPMLVVPVRSTSLADRAGGGFVTGGGGR